MGDLKHSIQQKQKHIENNLVSSHINSDRGGSVDNIVSGSLKN